MSNSTQPPKRNSSLTMTAVSPRPPLSTKLLAAMDLAPDHPETIEMLAQAIRDEAKTRETLMQCEQCIASPCPCCRQIGMITPTRAAQFAAAQNMIVALDEPGVGEASEPEPFDPPPQAG